MSRNPRVINGNPNTFNANGAGVNPGDLVIDFTGAVPGVSIIERTSATNNTRVLLAPASSVAPYAFNPSLTFVPGAAGAFSITGTVVDGEGQPITSNAHVEVTLSATGNLTVGAFGAGSQLEAKVGTGTPNVLVRLLTSATGTFSFAMTGTATQFVTVVGRVIDPAGNTHQADGTIPS